MTELRDRRDPDGHDATTSTTTSPPPSGWCAMPLGQGARIILIPELFEGPYFCKDQLPEHLALARRLAGPSDRRALRRGRGRARRRPAAERVRARRPGAVQLGRDRRRRRLRARHLPQEPHSRRAGLHREVLLLPGRHRIPGVEHGARHDRCRHLLGPVVPRVGALHGAARRRGAPVSDGDRQRAARPGVGLVGALAAGDAGACRSEPDAARGGQSGRPRGRPDVRHHLLRLVVHRRQHRRRRSPRPVATARRCIVAAFDRDATGRTQRAAWGLFRDRRPELYGPITTLDGRAWTVGHRTSPRDTAARRSGSRTSAR